MSRIVIVGASRGIGLELARLAAKSGHTVTGTCRSMTPPSEPGIRWVTNVDVTTDEGAARVAKETKEPIDVLVHNAGILEDTPLAGLSLSAVEHQLVTNAVAPLRMVHALLPHLANGSRVGLVTSRMGSMGDNTSGGSYGYRMSKAALNAAGVSLAHDLRPKGIAVVLLHPGYVKTDMTGGHGQVEPQEAARGIMARLDELTVATTGRFLHANGDVLPW